MEGAREARGDHNEIVHSFSRHGILLMSGGRTDSSSASADFLEVVVSRTFPSDRIMRCIYRLL